MSGSQNAFFIGTAPPDPEEEPHPPGIALAEQLVEAMRAAGLAFAPPDNWRDVGWSSSCEIADVGMELSLSTSDQQHWFLQVGALPAAIRPTIAERETVARCRSLSFQAATAVQPLLAATFQSVRWALDADPSQGPTSPQPTDPEQS
jgi:hypothetical protein